MKLSDLNPNPANPRKIDPWHLDALKKSLEKFGDLSGIVFNKRTGRLVGGHQRIKVLPPDSEILMTSDDRGHVKVGENTYTYREVDWDEQDEMAANIAANKQGGEWDQPKLNDWLLELDSANYDMELVGFSPFELEQTLVPIHNFEPQSDEDSVPEKVEPKTKPGDLYQLGRHRLLCGDSTNIQHVERLMGGDRADMCFTSPPYNLGNNAKLRGYNGDGNDSAYIEKNDHKSNQEYLDFLTSFTSIALSVSDTVFINIQLLAGNKLVIPDYWHFFKKNLVDIFCWDKEHAAPQMAARVLNSVWEFIFIFSNEDMPTRSMKHGPDFRGNIDNIYRLNPVGKKDPLAKDHGAVFPVQFCEFFVSNFSDKLIYEPFAGSGSTLIACEKTHRKCYGMEIDPHYCDVIVARWEKYTGKKAELIEPIPNQ